MSYFVTFLCPNGVCAPTKRAALAAPDAPSNTPLHTAMLRAAADLEILALFSGSTIFVRLNGFSSPDPKRHYINFKKDAPWYNYNLIKHVKIFFEFISDKLILKIFEKSFILDSRVIPGLYLKQFRGYSQLK